MLTAGVSVATAVGALDVGLAACVTEDDGELDEDDPTWFDRSDIKTPARTTATIKVAATPNADARRAGPRPNGKPGENRTFDPLFSRVTSPAYSNTDPGTGG
jgi:hypothetical protein